MMTEQQQRRLDFEESFFSMLFGEEAGQMGVEALALSQRLNSDDGFVVPDELRRKGKEAIGKHQWEQGRRRAKRSALRLLQTVAIVALACGVLFTTAFAAVPEFRNKTLELIVRTFESGTEFRFSGPEEAPPPLPDEGEAPLDRCPDQYSGWLPEGFQYLGRERSASHIRYEFSSATGAELWANVYNGEGSALLLDTENAQIRYITLGDARAQIVAKQGLDHEEVFVVWSDEENYLLYTVMSVGMPEEQVVEFVRHFQDFIG